MAGNSGVFDYASPPGGGGGGCGMVLLESMAGFALAVFVAYGAREISYLIGGTTGVAVASLVWVLAFAGVMVMALRSRVGYVIGFLTLAGMMALLVGLCGWSTAFH